MNQIKISLLFSSLLLCYTSEAKDSIDIDYCYKAYGIHQRTLEDCFSAIAELNSSLVKNYDLAFYRNEKSKIDSTCNQEYEEAVKDGIGSGGAMIIPGCQAEKWGLARDKLLNAQYGK